MHLSLKMFRHYKSNENLLIQIYRFYHKKILSKFEVVLGNLLLRKLSNKITYSLMKNGKKLIIS